MKSVGTKLVKFSQNLCKIIMFLQLYMYILRFVIMSLKLFLYFILVLFCNDITLLRARTC